MMFNKKNIFLAYWLVFVLAAVGQPRSQDVQAFNQSSGNNLSEKIFTHTDKDFYLAGEIVWFKLYVVDGSDNKPIDISKVAYVEIIDRNQKPVLQCKIDLKNGMGHGSLYLPLALASGVYQLRAYTSWMKNFSAELYFHKQLKVVNSLRSAEQSNRSRGYDIQFFPEGGNMVQGIQSTVAFKIIDRFGKGADAKGVIVNNNGDIVAQFHPLKFGIGHFSFKPIAGVNYKAVITLGDTTITTEMPTALDRGYVLTIEPVDGSKVQFSVATNVPSARQVYLFISKRRARDVPYTINLSDGNGEFVIDKNDFGEGVSRITLFDAQGVPQCERLFFKQPRQKLVIMPAVDQQEVSSRKKVSIAVNSTDELKKPTIAGMSVSIYRVDSLQQNQDENIDNYFWLTSELKGNIESPGYYFSDTSAEVDEATNNLMLTHGWRRFVGQNANDTLKGGYQFVPEYRGHIIYAKVTNATSGLPTPDVVAYLSVPGSRIQLYSAKSDSLGNVRFYTRDFYGPNEIVLQARASGDTTYRLQIVSPFSEKFSSENLPLLNLPQNIKGILADYNVSTQVQNNYSGENLKHFFAPMIDTTAFFGKPDAQYLLDNYTRFSTMEEVLREYVYEVLVRRQKENFRFIVTDGENRIFLDDPLTLFNGVPVFDPNKIIRYDPLNVKKIEVVKRKYFYGPSVFNGIVNFVTYYPDPSMVSDLSPVVMEYEGLQYQREFYSPVYDTPEQISSRLPDFRNVLYWSPDIQTDGQGKTEINFFTSDLKGRYIAVLQGLSADGRVGEKSISFEVK
ncbi:MAG TPA: hypothetical protein VFP87_12235 [Chitinophagaceae bacterium]|nr:hypothetical protein [Chitinophagaceae bacterium]